MMISMNNDDHDHDMYGDDNDDVDGEKTDLCAEHVAKGGCCEQTCRVAETSYYLDDHHDHYHDDHDHHDVDDRHDDYGHNG